MPLLELDEELRLYFETFGETNNGPWVTLVNGYTRTLTDFKAMARYLSERGKRVLTFDNRGVGKTDYPPIFTLDDLANDVLALWKHLHITESHLLGISFGGAIAATLAAKQPPVLKKLMLVSTPIDAGFTRIESSSPPRDPKKFTLQYTRYFSASFLKENSLLVQGFLRQVAKTFLEPESALGARAQREAMQELDLLPLLSQIQVPTLVLQGDSDGIVPVASAQKIASEIPQSQCEILEGIGHLLLVECPLRFYQITDGYFS